MTASSFNIFIIFTIYLSSIFHSSHGFKVIQPNNRYVNPDGSASISCEHTANGGSVADVRLYGLSLPDKSEPSLLCQKGMKDCKNITMYQENHNKWLFVMLNIGQEAMNMAYQCEFTVETNNIYEDETGTPTILLPGEKEVACLPHPKPPPPPPPPPPPQVHQLWWILIGLLALMFLYSCVMTSFYVRLRCGGSDLEDSTYVEMRKAPPPRNPAFDMYYG